MRHVIDDLEEAARDVERWRAEGRFGAGATDADQGLYHLYIAIKRLKLAASVAPPPPRRPEARWSCPGCGAAPCRCEVVRVRIANQGRDVCPGCGESSRHGGSWGTAGGCYMITTERPVGEWPPFTWWCARENRSFPAAPATLSNRGRRRR